VNDGDLTKLGSDRRSGTAFAWARKLGDESKFCRLPIRKLGVESENSQKERESDS